MPNEYLIQNLLNRFAATEENAVAFSVYDGKECTDITYRQFCSDILSTAGYFAENKIIHRNIALMAPNSYAWMTTYFAILASGNVAVFMNPDLPEDLLVWQSEKADVSMICCERSLQEEHGDAAKGITFMPFDSVKSTPLPMEKVYAAESSETVMMLFTSGTTGKSKAVEITASNLRYSIKNFEEPFTLDGMDRILTPIPFYHIFGFLHVAETLNYGKTVCVGRGIRYLFLDMAVLNPDMLNTVPAILESLVKSLRRNTSEQGNKPISCH